MTASPFGTVNSFWNRILTANKSHPAAPLRSERSARSQALWGSESETSATEPRAQQPLNFERGELRRWSSTLMFTGTRVLITAAKAAVTAGTLAIWLIGVSGPPLRAQT